MNWYSLFYWLTVSDGVKSVFDAASNILTFLTVITFIAYFVSIGVILDKSTHNDNSTLIKSALSWRKLLGKSFFILLTLSIVTWVGYAATPTKKDAMLIIAGGATMELLSNDSAAKQIPTEILNYVLVEIKSAAKESNIELNINSEKEKVINSVKNLSAEELLNKMKSDTTLKEILLSK